MMKRNSNEFVFCWAFWIGLSLLLLRFFKLFFISDGAFDESLRYRVDISLVGLATICLLSPIIEEFSFRFWSKGKLWSYLVSIGSIIILGFLSHALWLSLITAVLFGLCYLLIKDNKKRVITMMIVSSILFSINHLLTYSVIKIDVIIDLLSYLGFGLISCFIAININFLWSIVFHVLWNSIIVICFLFGWNNTDYSFETNNYIVNIEPQAKELSRIEIKDDTLSLTGPMINNVRILCASALEETGEPVNSRILFVADPKLVSSSMYNNMSIIDKSHGGASLHEVLRKMNELNYISTDTTYELMYRLEIGDSERLAKQSLEGDVDIKSLLVSLREKNIPVTAGVSVNIDSPLRRDVFELDNFDNTDVPKIANYIYEKYGLELRKSDGEFMQVIRISCGTAI